MSDECGARLYDERQDGLCCGRQPRHYNKPHSATGSWMTSDGRLVSAVVTWPVGAEEWLDDTEADT